MKTRRLRWRFYRKVGGARGVGNRCKAYCPGCIVCESYRFLDQHGRFPTFDEVSPICDEENRKEHEAWLMSPQGVAWATRSAQENKS